MVRQSPAAPPTGDLSFPIGPRGVWGSGPQALLGQGHGLSPEWARLASHGLTYCVALAVGGRLGLSAIVKRGVWCGNPLWYSCLENPMDRGAWPARVGHD